MVPSSPRPTGIFLALLALRIQGRIFAFHVLSHWGTISHRKQNGLNVRETLQSFLHSVGIKVSLFQEDSEPVRKLSPGQYSYYWKPNTRASGAIFIISNCKSHITLQSVTSQRESEILSVIIINTTTANCILAFGDWRTKKLYKKVVEIVSLAKVNN